MGFLFHAIELPKFLTLKFLWSHFKFLIIFSLTHLGLYKSNSESESESESNYNPNSYILLLDGTCPSLITVPIEVATAAVKLKVPVVAYRDFLLLRPRPKDGINEEEGCCTICLDGYELEDEVRELITCSHVFHKGCLDTWINDGHAECFDSNEQIVRKQKEKSRLQEQLNNK